MKSETQFKKIFLLLVLISFSYTIFSQNTYYKKGGVCFRIDDTQQKQKWNEYASVFNKFGMKFTMGQCLDGNLWDTAYINLIRNFSAQGHEFMDHSPSHTTTHIIVLNYSDTGFYSGNPFVHHINGKKICLKYNDTINSSSGNGLINITNGNTVISHSNGEFGNMNGNPIYFAIYIPSFNGVYTFYDLQNKIATDPDTIKLKSFWNENIILPDSTNLLFHKISQYAMKMPFGSRRIIAERTVNLCNQLNLPVPKTWIHPGGSFPMFSKNDIKEVWANEFGYTAAATYQQGSIKCFNEYDPFKEKRYGVMWGDFIEENWTMPAIKAKIADGIAKHYVVFGQSHFVNLTGGWTGYLERMDTLLNWLQTNDIDVKTYHDWTSILFDSISNPFINIFPQPNIDLDANGIPDGYINTLFYDASDGVITSGNTCFSKTSTGTLCEVQNLAGLEKGNNLFSIYTKGASGDSVLVKITYPEYSISINKKVPANQLNWTKYSFIIEIPEIVSKATFNFSVSNYSSGIVKISGFELRKISEVKIQKSYFQKRNATESFIPVHLNQLLSESYYPLHNISIQYFTQNTNLIYNLDSTNILTVNRPFSYWIGKDSLKIMVSNPDGTKDSSYFVFESVNPEICINDTFHFQLSENFINVNWSSQPPDITLNTGNYYSQTVKPYQNTVYSARCVNLSGDTVLRYFTLIVHNLPNAYAGNNITKCYGDSVVLAATGGIQYLWNQNVIQNEAFSAVNSGVYTVEVIDNNSCKSKDSLFLTVLPAISAGIIDSIQPICYQSVALIKTSNSKGNIQWQVFENQQWIAIQNANDTIYNTGSLISDKTFRTKASHAFCDDKYSFPFTLIVNPQVISGIFKADSTVCTGTSVKLSVEGHNSNIEWQKSDNGISNWQTIGFSLQNDSVFYSPSINSKTFFRSKISSNNCPGLYTNLDSVVITNYPQSGILTVGSQICKDDSTILILNGYSDSILWQIKPLTGSIWTVLSNKQQSQIYTNSLQNTSLVRVKVSNSICSAIYSNIDTVFVFNPSNSGIISGNSLICQGNTAKLKLSSYLGFVDWQYKTLYQPWVSYNGNFVNDTLLTNAINENVNFRVVAQNGVCPPDTSQLFQIIIDSISLGGIAIANSPICTADSTEIHLSGYRGNIQWQMSYNWGNSWTNLSNTYSGINSAILKTPALTSGNLYRATVKNGICPVAYSLPDTIAVNPMTQAGNANVISPICSGLTTKCYLYSFTGQLQWQESFDLINWNDVVTGSSMNSTPYTTPVLNSTQYYRAKVKSGVCPVKFSNYDTIVVNPLITPAITIEMFSGNNPQCAPADTVKFRANFSGEGNNPVFQWKKGWSNIGNNDSVLSIIPVNNDQIKCQLTSNALCATPNNTTSNILTLIVNPLPSLYFVLPASIDTVCSSASYVPLSGGIPNSGVFSGTGVNNNIFNPNSVGTGSYLISYSFTNTTTGCSKTLDDTIFVVNCTNIEEKNSNELLIYPNPTDNFLFINCNKCNQPITIEIQSLNGEILLNKLLNNENINEIEHNLPSGIYLLIITTGNSKIVRKLNVIRQ